jgi:hypothetical protein
MEEEKVGEIENRYGYKITNAEIKGEEVVVHASFFNGEEKVKEIIHAFSREMSEEDIRGMVEKALNLYVAELAQAKEQKIVEEATKKDNELINNLIDN